MATASHRVTEQTAATVAATCAPRTARELCAAGGDDAHVYRHWWHCSRLRLHKGEGCLERGESSVGHVATLCRDSEHNRCNLHGAPLVQAGSELFMSESRA